MTLEQFIQKLETNSNDLVFEETMSIIDDLYVFTEVSFKNGNVTNKAGENSGSCRLFAFAQLNNLNKANTLICFGQYYRDVLNSPDADSHQNIRQFMINGWSGISFSQQALALK